MDEVFPRLMYNTTHNPHRLSIRPFYFWLTSVLLNTGGIRFDLFRGNFTLNDEKTVSPFTNAFVCLRDIPYKDARIVLYWLNTGRFGYVVQDDCCHIDHRRKQMGISWGLRDQVSFTLQAPQGYVTYDGRSGSCSPLTLDFGSDGDDTFHTPYPYYDIPLWVQSTLVPSTISDNDVVDLIFTNFSSSGVCPSFELSYSRLSRF